MFTFNDSVTIFITRGLLLWFHPNYDDYYCCKIARSSDYIYVYRQFPPPNLLRRTLKSLHRKDSVLCCTAKQYQDPFSDKIFLLHGVWCFSIQLSTMVYGQAFRIMTWLPHDGTFPYPPPPDL